MLCLGFLFDDLNKINFVLAVFGDSLLLLILSAILLTLSCPSHLTSSSQD